MLNIRDYLNNIIKSVIIIVCIISLVIYIHTDNVKYGILSIIGYLIYINIRLTDLAEMLTKPDEFDIEE